MKKFLKEGLPLQEVYMRAALALAEEAAGAGEVPVGCVKIGRASCRERV